MEFFVRAMGVKRVQTKFDRMGAAAIDATPAFITIADIIYGIERATFEGQGRRGGGSWKQLSADWLNRKLRLGLDPRINHATLALRKSMTEPGDSNQILEIKPQSLTLASDLPYAGTAQRNRPFVQFLPSDRAMIRTVIRDHLIAAWKYG